MKKVFLAAAVLAVLASGSALAGDQITINGELLSQGCTVGNNGGADITLNKVTSAQVEALSVGEELQNQAASFKISNCPAYEVRIQFDAQAPEGFEEVIVNDNAASGEFVGHFLQDARRSGKWSLTKPGQNVVYLAGDEAQAAQSVDGFQFPVRAGYTKIKDIGADQSPVGLTSSTVNLTITYAQ